jgi:NAD(P)-dependent dehydrogenase (short-subunit alcohol dehydrogenase family)
MQCAGKVVLVTGAQQGIARGFVDARGQRSGNRRALSEGRGHEMPARDFERRGLVELPVI